MSTSRLREKRTQALDKIISLLSPLAILRHLVNSIKELKESALEENDVQALGRRLIDILATEAASAEEQSKYKEQVYEAVYKACYILNQEWPANLKTAGGLEDPITYEKITTDNVAITSGKYQFDINAIAEFFERRPGINPFTSKPFSKRDLESLRKRAREAGLHLRLPEPPALVVNFVRALVPEDAEGHSALQWRLRLWALTIFAYHSITTLREEDSSYSQALAIGLYNAFFVTIAMYLLARIGGREVFTEEASALRTVASQVGSTAKIIKDALFKDPLLASLPKRPKLDLSFASKSSSSLLFQASSSSSMGSTSHPVEPRAAFLKKMT